MVFGIYLEKFKERLTYLKYRIFFNAIGTTSQHNYWGNIEVRHNGRVTNHLSFVTIEIQNDSNKDLQNVSVDIWADKRSQILGHSGNYNETGNVVGLESSYYSYFNDVLKRSEEDEELKQSNPQHQTPVQLLSEREWVQCNKKFILPVFNRHTGVKLNLLIENFEGKKPILTVSILHKSIKLIRQEDQETENKKLGLNVIIWGIVIYFFVTVMIIFYFPESKLPIKILGVTGVLYLAFGFFAYRIFLFVKRSLT